MGWAIPGRGKKFICTRFEVFISLMLRIPVFWDVNAA
jgi:hypothetical protein